MPTEPQIYAFVNCIVDYIIDRRASAAAEPPGHTLAGHPEDLGLLPVDRLGQRVAAAPALALPQHHGGPAGPAGGSGGRPHALLDNALVAVQDLLRLGLFGTGILQIKVTEALEGLTARLPASQY